VGEREKKAKQAHQLSSATVTLICYPDMFGTDMTCYETYETRSAAQFKDSFRFEESGTSLEEI